tara:strand:+ start:75 stop:320 length:246 start_codon:yes stop_codon:yes gene_type:complete
METDSSNTSKNSKIENVISYISLVVAIVSAYYSFNWAQAQMSQYVSPLYATLIGVFAAVFIFFPALYMPMLIYLIFQKKNS